MNPLEGIRVLLEAATPETTMPAQIVFSNSAVQQISGGQTKSIAWVDISEIHTYRLDAITHEVIYVVLQHVNGHSFELRDDMNGWDELLTALASLVGRPVEDIRSRILSLKADDEPIVLYPGDA